MFMMDTRVLSYMQFMNDVGQKLDAHSYPATTSELIDAYGETQFEMDDAESLGDALSRLAEETYDSSEAARLATISAVGAGAIGRKGYSDRDAPAVGENSEAEILSF